MLKKVKKKQNQKFKNEWNLTGNSIEFKKHKKLEFSLIYLKC